MVVNAWEVVEQLPIGGGKTGRNEYKRSNHFGPKGKKF